jgi:DNA-binding NtrC family response regulator
MRLMLVEDKDTFRRLLMQTLKDSVWETEAFADPREALLRLEAEPFDVLVTDLRLPGFSGLELLRRAKRARPGLRVLLMSAFGEARDVVEAMRCGADDFLPKPFDLDLFLAMLDKLRALVGAPPPDPGEPWIALSRPMRELDRGMEGAAETTLPALFCGEPGSGRARSSRRLHTLTHPRAPYAVLAASSLNPEGPGADLIRMVEGGSLFLLDLDQIPGPAVAGLLRAMDSPSGARVRWMAGGLAAAALPEPLRHRFGALQFDLPRLRERREDILPLLRMFLERSARAEGTLSPAIDRGAERQALEHAWPGNLKELGEVAVTSLRGAQGGRLRSLDLGGSMARISLPLPTQGSLESRLKELQRSAEGMLLQKALEEAEGGLPQVAERLGLTVRALGLRLREHGIPLERA